MKNNKNKLLTLSIIIPVYNEERHIEDCLDSISKQTIMPDKVIVVDNNCTDGTIAIAQKYKFVEVVEESNQGVVYARNKGFDSVKSDIIGRIDADVILPDNWVERVIEYFNKKDSAGSALTGCGYFRNFHAFPKSVTYKIQDIMTFRLNKLILGHYALWGSNMAMLHSDWLKVKKQVCLDTTIHEDLDLAIHLHRANVKIHYMPDLGVVSTMKRISFSKKPELYKNLLLWPNTVRKHNNPKWVFGWLGAQFLFINGLWLTPVNMAVTRIKYGHWPN